jgi:hypothetical protein
MKKFIVMFGVIKEVIEMASSRGDCICCRRVFHQIDETLMDEPMALMIMIFFAGNVTSPPIQEGSCLQGPCSYKNPSGHDKDHDKHDIYLCPPCLSWKGKTKF